MECKSLQEFVQELRSFARQNECAVSIKDEYTKLKIGFEMERVDGQEHFTLPIAAMKREMNAFFSLNDLKIIRDFWDNSLGVKSEEDKQKYINVFLGR